MTQNISYIHNLICHYMKQSQLELTAGLHMDTCGLIYTEYQTL